MRINHIGIFVLVYLGQALNPVWAFSSATVRQLTNENSRLPMESADPVTVGLHVYMAYSSHRKLVFRRSDNEGRSFAAQRLDDGNATWVNQPRIAANGTNVYVVWEILEDGVSQLIFRLSTDFGASFAPAVALGETTAIDDPQIAADGPGLTVAFVNADLKLVLASSADGGLTWPYKQVMQVDQHAREETVGRLGQRIVASWSEISETNGRVSNYTWVATSADAGVHYFVRKLVEASAAAKERLVTVSATTGTWYIYGYDLSHPQPSKHGAAGVLFTSVDGGMSFTEQTISMNTSPGSILVHRSTIYLTWLEYFPDGTHVMLTYSLDDVRSWGRRWDISGTINAPSPQPDEVYLPSISLVDDLFSEAYVTSAGVMARSTHDITRDI